MFKIDYETAADITIQMLADLAHENSDDKKLKKSIKHILAWTMIPEDWEAIYGEDYVKYHNKKG